ncbi:MAG: CoA-binding protein [Psychroflexus sp.]
MKNKTLVIGASENLSRYSNKAIRALLQNNHDVIALGKKKGEVKGIEIQTEISTDEQVDTVTLYINPNHQKQYKNFLLDLDPERVIFNPGTENSELQKELKEAGIQTLNACTLVLLATNQY